VTESEPQQLRGKTAVITGASSGIGAAAARKLAELGATVAVVGRSPEKTAAVAARIAGRAHPVDYGRLDDVRRLAAELLAAYERIDILANNAGAMFGARTTSADGHEMTFQVNYLAPFLLTSLLLPRLAAAPDGARVINTASGYTSGQLDLEDLDWTRRRYRSQPVYAAAKRAVLLFTRELARRTHRTGVAAAAFHPGVVATDIGRDVAIVRLVMKSPLGKAVLATPVQGAEPLLRLAAVADLRAASGSFFNRLKPASPADGQDRDAHLARELWDRSASLTGIQPNPPASLRAWPSG
jgi:NAD(P)-dependent dehydrogenase (short-subunit alcohol dehydrogenase family)